MNDQILPQESQAHPKTCPCPDCFFLPVLKDAEHHLFWVENRLAKCAPDWREHWQQQLNYACQSLNYWRRQYQAGVRTEGQL